MRSSPPIDAATRTASRSVRRRSSAPVYLGKWPGRHATNPPVWTVRMSFVHVILETLNWQDDPKISFQILYGQAQDFGGKEKSSLKATINLQCLHRQCIHVSVVVTSFVLQQAASDSLLAGASSTPTFMEPM